MLAHGGSVTHNRIPLLNRDRKEAYEPPMATQGVEGTERDAAFGSMFLGSDFRRLRDSPLVEPGARTHACRVRTPANAKLGIRRWRPRSPTGTSTRPSISASPKFPSLMA